MKLRPAPKKSKQLVYLDHAATTPVDLSVVKTMAPYWTKEFGNPSSLYKLGRVAHTAITQARQTIAEILNAQAKEIVFTAGGTESANLAIFGVARAYLKQHKKPGHIITTTIEHHAVLRACEQLAEEGWSVSYIPVSKEGIVDLKQLKAAVQANTALVSIMYANNEMGAIQPITEVGKWLKHSINPERHQKKLSPIYFHSDACQAAGSLDLNVQKLGIDLLTINASKIYGPKQMGALYVRSGTPLTPLVVGGGQEFDYRSGTENTAGIVGFATALELAEKLRTKETKRLLALQHWFITAIKKSFPAATINGPMNDAAHTDNNLKRLPNNINVTFPDVEGEALLLYLDGFNIAASTGSACAATSTDPSHVMLALGLSPEEASSSIRFTMGRTTTKAELVYTVKVLEHLVPMLSQVQKLS
jgi:cysteine desulfurase